MPPSLWYFLMTAQDDYYLKERNNRGEHIENIYNFMPYFYKHVLQSKIESLNKGKNKENKEN